MLDQRSPQRRTKEVDWREAPSFNERLWREFKRREHEFELSSDDNESVSYYEQKVKILTALVIFTLVALFVFVVSYVMAAILGRAVDDASVAICCVVIVAAAGACLSCSELRAKTLRYVKSFRHPTDPLSPTDPLAPTANNVGVYLKCISSASQQGGEEDIANAAKAFEVLLIKARDMRDRLEHLKLTNAKFDHCDEARRMIEKLEQAVALEIHHSINALVGCGKEEFLRTVAPVTEDCRVIFGYADEFFESLVDYLSGAVCDVKIPAGLQELLAGVDAFLAEDEESDETSDDEASDDEASDGEASDDETSDGEEGYRTSEDFETQDFWERLKKIIEKNFERLDIADKDTIDGYRVTLEREMENMAIWGKLANFASIVLGVVTFASGIFFAEIFCTPFGDHLAACALMGIVIGMSILATCFVYAHCKYVESCRAVETLNEQIRTAKEYYTVGQTPKSARTIVAGILSICTDTESDMMASALSLKETFDDFDGLRERYLALSKFNDILAADEIEKMLDAAEEAIALSVYRAINTLLGVGETAFVHKATPKAAKKCREINQSLEQTLKGLVDCLNRDDGDLEQTIAEMESLTTAYRQFAEQDFPTAKDDSVETLSNENGLA